MDRRILMKVKTITISTNQSAHIELGYDYTIYILNQILAPQEIVLQYVLPHICTLFIVFLWPIYGWVDEILIIDPYI